MTTEGTGLRRRLAYWRLRARSRNPRTFQHKVLRKLAYDRDPLLTTLCDRVAVREVVESTVGPDHLSGVHAVAPDPDEIDWAALPREYVAKTNHGSGAMVFVREDADPEARLPSVPRQVGWERLHVRPEHADPDLLRPLLRHWLTLDYSWYPGKRTPEWAYQGIRPQVLVEELLRGEDGRLPVEYKSYVIHGRCHFTLLTFDRFDDSGTRQQTHAYYDRDWHRIDLRFVSHGTALALAGELPPPSSQERRIIPIVEGLGALTDAVRVDLYVLGDRIVFGELTPYQNAGEGHYLPRSFDEALAAAWRQDY